MSFKHYLNKFISVLGDCSLYLCMVVSFLFILMKGASMFTFGMLFLTANSMDNRGLLQHFSGLDKHHRRNLIFDEERFEETFLKCFICRESYNHTDKLPKILQCHHTFCVDCLCQVNCPFNTICYTYIYVL